MVVLPEDSGPKTSMTRPRGSPPTPSAASSEIDPVEITETGTRASFDPRRRIEPLPNCFSIWLKASSKARKRSFPSMTVITPGDVLKNPLYQRGLRRSSFSAQRNRKLSVLFPGGAGHRFLWPVGMGLRPAKVHEKRASWQRRGRGGGFGWGEGGDVGVFYPGPR